VLNCEKLTKTFKTRSRYASLAAVLRNHRLYFLPDKSERNTNTDF